MTDKPTRPRLSQRKLRAMEEALNARLAGEVNAEFGDTFYLSRDDYQAALDWVQSRIRES